LEIQLRRLPARRQVQRPDVDPGDDTLEIGRIEIDDNALQLNELCEFPKNNRRNTPWDRGQELKLKRLQSAFEGVNQNVVSRFSWLFKSSRHQVAGDLDFSLHAADQIGAVRTFWNHARDGFTVPGDNDALGIEVVKNRQALRFELRGVDMHHMATISDWSVIMSISENSGRRYFGVEMVNPFVGGRVTAWGLGG
jgi:hypothetical protein